MPPEHSVIVHLTFGLVKFSIFTLAICRSGVGQHTETLISKCPKGQVISFQDSNICVIPLDDVCEDNDAEKLDTSRCGPGAECSNTTCKCLKGFKEHRDRSGCKLSNGSLNLRDNATQPPKLPSTVASLLPNVLLPPMDTATKSTKAISNALQQKSTINLDFVVQPTTVTQSQFQQNVTTPNTVVLTNPNIVVLAPYASQLISRTGSYGYGSKSNQTVGGYGAHRYPGNNTGIATQTLDLRKFIAITVISSFAFSV